MIMKKLIILIVIVVIVVILVKTFYIEGPISKEQPSNKDNDIAKSFYEISEERITLENFLGFPLPKIDDKYHGQVYFDWGIGTENARKLWWLVAKLSEDVFYKLVEQANFQKTLNLLEVWPDAFLCQHEDFADKYWDVKNAVNDGTFYGEDPEYEARMLLKYENGVMYFKKEEIYLTLKDENGTILHKKAKKRQLNNEISDPDKSPSVRVENLRLRYVQQCGSGR